MCASTTSACLVSVKGVCMADDRAKDITMPAKCQCLLLRNLWEVDNKGLPGNKPPPHMLWLKFRHRIALRGTIQDMRGNGHTTASVHVLPVPQEHSGSGHQSPLRQHRPISASGQIQHRPQKVHAYM
jgi:hypothetical protein